MQRLLSSMHGADRIAFGLSALRTRRPATGLPPTEELVHMNVHEHVMLHSVRDLLGPVVLRCGSNETLRSAIEDCRHNASSLERFSPNVYLNVAKNL